MDDKLEELRKRADVIMAAEAAQAKIPRPSVLYVRAGAYSVEAAPPAESAPVAQAAVPPVRPPAPPHAAAAAAPRKPDGRFAKGVSGNKRGRPKTEVRAYTSLQFAVEQLAELEEPVEVRSNGKVKKVPFTIAAIKRLKQKALKDGDPRTIETLLKLQSHLVKMFEASAGDIGSAIARLETMLKYEMDPAKVAELRASLTYFKHLSRPYRG